MLKEINIKFPKQSETYLAETSIRVGRTMVKEERIERLFFSSSKDVPRLRIGLSLEAPPFPT